jgi:hypothetical protein
MDNPLRGYRLTNYSGYALMILLPLGITNKFVLLSLTRKIHRITD